MDSSDWCMEPIVLASGSPRRQEYFRLLGLPFTCMPSSVDESFDPNAEPRTIVEELAVRKLNKTLELLAKESPLSQTGTSWVCGADTLISLDGKIYGKPLNREDAGRMIRAFQGRSHEVISALALHNRLKNTTDCRSVISTVTFASLTSGEIEWYLDSGEWQDAAGAYKIQGLASCFISDIKGSYSSIVGLPLHEFYVMLRENGYQFGSQF